MTDTSVGQLNEWGERRIGSHTRTSVITASLDFVVIGPGDVQAEKPERNFVTENAKVLGVEAVSHESKTSPREYGSRRVEQAKKVLRTVSS